MPVQCSVCLSPDTDNDWSVLLTCGHCFHTVCLQQALEYRRRCPNCRVEVPKSRSNTQPFRKVFFQHSEDAGGDVGSTGGGEEPVDVSVGQLQMQLLVKEQRLQQLGIKAHESAERIEKLEEEVQLAQRSLRKKEEKLARTILELTQLSKQNKAAHNELANLRVELKQEQTVAARYKLAMGTDLVGGALDRELSQLVEQDVQVPSWFKKMLEVRNKQISEVTNRLQHLERQKQQAEGHLRHEIDKLQKQVVKLKQQAESQQQQQVAAVEPGPAFRHAVGRGPSFLPRPAGTGGGSSRHLGFAAVDEALGGGGLFGGSELDYVPAPRATKAAGSKTGLRQRMERLSGKTAGGNAGVAVNDSVGPTLECPSAQQHDLQARHDVGGAHPSGQEALGTCCAIGKGDDGGFVLLEELEGALQAALAGGSGGLAGGGRGEDMEEEGGSYSEVESEEEVELVDEDGGMEGAPAPLQQQHQGGSVPALQPPGSALGPLLGKRPSPQNDPEVRHQQSHPPPPALRQQQQQPRQQLAPPPNWHGVADSCGTGSCSVAAQGAVPSALQPSNRAGYAPLPMKAGPAPGHIGAGPGPSFLRDPQRATTGLDAQAKYIHRGPDGKGGLVSVYKSGGGDAKAVQQPGASRQKQKGKAAGGTTKPANGGVTIDLFFGRASN